MAGAANPPLSIIANPLAGGFVGQPYSTTLAATGGNPPYTWKLVSGSGTPPKGLKLNKSTGVISGTPTSHAVTSTFTIEVLDTKMAKVKKNTATATFAITIGVTTMAIAATNGLHTCALLTGGTVDCWGHNHYGQLGNGTTADSPTLVPVSGLSGITAIATGVFHTCALLTGGTVDCWGANPDGELGNGTTTDSSTPVTVGVFSGATAISAGGAHTCALVPFYGGIALCWGNNYVGQLGNGTTTNSSTPVPVSGLSGVTAIATGGNHTCALLTGGTVDCWGENTYGELGNGTRSNSSTPVVVLGLP